MGDYKTAFKREMYRYALEDFQDSFTPGGAPNYKNKRPVMIPLSWYDEKARIVESSLMRKGWTRPAGFNPREVASEIFDYSGKPHTIKEVQAMSDSGELKANPSTPRIPAEMYDDLPFFKEFFGVSGMKKNPSGSKSELELWREFKSASTLISQLFLNQRLDVANADLAFRVGASAEEQKRVALNQYRRYMFWGVLLGLIRKAYEMKPSDIDAFLEMAGVKDMTAKQLQREDNIRAFGQNMTRLMDSLFGAQDLGKAILRQASAMSKQKRLK